MKITYFGTAAAEGWPGLFCRCEACEKARALGGRNIRTRSQALIDDGLLLDLPPDTYMHVLYGGLDLTAVHSLLVTHTHFDHYAPHELWCRSPGIAYGLREDVPVLKVFGSEFVCENFLKRPRPENEEKRVDFEVVRSEQTFTAGDYTVTALPADHGRPGDAFIYAIEKEGKSLFYCHDTGYLTDTAWGWLEKTGKRFDLISLDCTNIVGDGRRGHMGVSACREVKARLLELGAADENTVFVLNHFSHNGKTVYDDLAAELEGEFTVSYDGLVIEF